MTDVVLLVDDDAAFRDVYADLLADEGWQVVQAGDGDEARVQLARHRPAVVVLDLMLPPTGRPEEGARICDAALAADPGAKVVVVSGTGETALALALVERGAYDFLQKPVEPEVLIHVLGRARVRRSLEARVAALEASLAAPAHGGGLLGSSVAFEQARTLCERAAPTDVPVLLTGETGTGKEVFARYLHNQSRRGAGPFVAINCGALSPSLLESTLFGHKKGAFTGAIRDEPGLVRAAEGGTLFLDEIGDMDPALQVKLLRTLEAKEVQPVGAAAPVAVDVRVVSATHRPIAELVAQGTFREDLYWRIRGIEIALPRLAERAGDLPLLAQHFLNQARALVPGAAHARLSAEAIRRMELYAWPGNLRELRHEMQRGLVLAAGRDEILPEDLSLAIGRSAAPPAPGGERDDDDDEAPLETKIAALERREIQRALRAADGNKSEAARRLGLSRQGLLDKLARHDLG